MPSKTTAKQKAARTRNWAKGTLMGHKAALQSLINAKGLTLQEQKKVHLLIASYNKILDNWKPVKD